MTQRFGLLMRALALSAALGVPAAHAAVIDFEGDGLTGLYFPGDSFSQGDYTLMAKTSFGTIDTAAGLGSLAPSGDGTQFYFNSNDGSLVLARTDGAAFNLASFSAAFVPQDPASSQLTVLQAVATRADNSQVSSYWLFSSTPSGQSSFQGYDASGGMFDGVTQIEFHACSWVGGQICTQATMNNGQFAIDDIAVTAVPEATTSVLMALGLFGLGMARRARRSNAR